MARRRTNLSRIKITKKRGYKKPKLPDYKIWLDALESGKYRQTQGTLCKVDKHSHRTYCCLGVLCKVQGKLEKDGLNFYDAHGNTSDYDALALENPVAEAMDQQNGDFPDGVIVTIDNEITRDLVSCNDNRKCTFKEIAYIIRQIWKA